MGEGSKFRRQMPKAPEGLNSFGEAVGGDGRLIQPSSSLWEIIVLYYLADCDSPAEWWKNCGFCRKSTKLGTIIVYDRVNNTNSSICDTPLVIVNFVSMTTHSFPVPCKLFSILIIFCSKNASQVKCQHVMPKIANLLTWLKKERYKFIVGAL